MNRLYPWHEEPWQRWIGLRSRLPHAILLKGAQGTGKFDFAMNLAQSLLCEKPLADGLACQNCPSCHWFLQETHPDFRLLQPDDLADSEDDEGSESKRKKPSSQISVDQIRTLADFSGLSAHQGGHRVVLIHPAEAMNPNAANALLKTLEEPSGRMLIILVSHKPQKLLPTILSRCLTLAMPLPTAEVSSEWLEQQGISNASVALAQTGFAPLIAAHLVEEGNDSEEYGHFLQEIMEPATFDPMALAEYLQKTKPAKVINWLLQWCYDLGSIKLTGRVRYNLELIDKLKHLSGNANVFSLIRYQKELLIASREALHPLNARLQFESLLLSYRQMMLARS